MNIGFAGKWGKWGKAGNSQLLVLEFFSIKVSSTLKEVGKGSGGRREVKKWKA
jgi:hypothetical protein